MDEKESSMLNIAKRWDEYLYGLEKNEREAVFKDSDKYWEEFRKFEKNFFEEHIR